MMHRNRFLFSTRARWLVSGWLWYPILGVAVCVALFSGPPKTEEESWYGEVEALAADGRVEEALSILETRDSNMAQTHFETRVADAPHDLGAQAALGVLSYKDREWDAAYDHFLAAGVGKEASRWKKSIRAGRRLHAFAWHSRYLAQSERSHVALAVECARSAVELAPEDGLFRRAHAKALLLSGAESAEACKEAEKEARKAIELEGPTAENQLLLSWILRARGFDLGEVVRKEAVELAEEALRLAEAKDPVDEELVKNCKQALNEAREELRGK